MTLYGTKRNTFILKCFLQCTCTNLDCSQKEGGNFLSSLQKEGGTQKGVVPSEKGGSNPGGNHADRFLMFLKECKYIEKEKCLETYIEDGSEFSSDEKPSEKD